jgi:hypothetical protein
VIGPPYLELSEGETTASADATVVLDSRASHNGPQTVDRARRDLGSLLEAGISPASFLASLELVCQRHRSFALQAPLRSARGV